MSESAEQRALFQWARFATAQHPDLRLLFAIPNGGARHKATAGRLKAEGVRLGVPDLCLPVPRGPYAALYIELKRPHAKGKPKGRTSQEQLWWLGELQAVGNFAGVVYGWQEARDMIEAYLKGMAQL
jgi:hypothetical protein